MKGKIILLSLLLLTKVVFSDGAVIPFNYSIVPYVNVFNGDQPAIFATGTISSNVYSIYGAQTAAVFSTTSSNMYGVQASGVFNISGGYTSGVQAGGVFNMANHEIYGAQVAGVFNMAGGNSFAAQCAGVFNIVDGDFGGFQGAGVFNIAEDVNKFSVQAAGVFNIADDMTGIQTAAIFNAADDITGAQIGVVNVADDTKGIQLGIVNISNDNDDDTIPIGLVNIYKSGIFNLGITYDGNGDVSYIYESGTSKLFTQLFYITNQENITKPFEDPIWGVGLGFKILKPIDVVVGIKRDLNSYRPTPMIKTSISLDFNNISITGGLTADLDINRYNRRTINSNAHKFELNEDVTLCYNWFAGVKINL